MSPIMKVTEGENDRADDTRSGKMSMKPSTKEEGNTDAAPPLEPTVDGKEDPIRKQEIGGQHLPSSANLLGIKVKQVKKETNGTVKVNNIAEKFAAKVKKIIRGEWHMKRFKMESNKGDKNTGSCNYKIVGFTIALMISVLCLASVIAPYCMTWLNYSMNPEFVLDFPLQNASFSPAVITYKLSETRIFKKKSFSGLIFSHDDLVTELGHFRELQPLLPLIDTDYDIITKCPCNTATRYCLATLLLCSMVLFCIFIITILSANSNNSVPKTTCMFESLEFFPAIAIVVIYLVLLGGPIFNEGNENRNVVINFPLKNMTFAPTYITYHFSDAYVFRIQNISGVIFSHYHLMSEFGNYFNGTASLTPLLPLVHPRYRSCNMQVNIAVTYPLLISVSFGIFLYIVCVIISIERKLGKGYRGIYSKKDRFKLANLKLEFERQQINI